MEDNVIYFGKVAYQLAYGAANVTELNFREGTVTISPCFGDNGMERYRSGFYKTLKSVSFPSSLRKIAEMAKSVDNMNLYLFNNCDELTTINLPEGLEEIGAGVFYDCPKLNVPALPSTLRKIGIGAFYGANMASITLPEGLEYCGGGAFANTPSLASVKLLSKNLITGGPLFKVESIEKITIGAKVECVPAEFAINCSNLVRVVWEEPEADGPTLAIGEYAFDQCSAAAMTLPRRLRTVGDYAFRRANFSADADLSQVENIGIRSFDQASGLTDLNLQNCSSIGRRAFSEMPDLQRVYYNLPTSEDFYQYDRLFYECSSLEEFTFGPDVEYVPERLLMSLDALRVVTFEPRGKQSRGDQAKELLVGDSFCSGSSSLHQVTFPDCRTAIGVGAFYNCRSLEILRLGEGLENINNQAFQGCSSLTAVDIPSSVVALGDQCFASGYGSELANLYFHSSTPPSLGTNLCPNTATAYVPSGSENLYRSTVLKTNPIEAYPSLSLSLDGEESSLDEGENLQLVATVSPAEVGSLQVNWASSNPGVATVDYFGNVVWAGSGTADITATVAFMPQYSATCRINGLGGVEEVVDDADPDPDSPEAWTDVSVYNLQGVRVVSASNGSSALKRLAPGLYIVVANGKSRKLRL